MSVPPAEIPQNHVTTAEEQAISPAAAASDDKPTLCLLIDNYDSFTFNLYQYLCQLGADMMVKRNDEITLDEIKVGWRRSRESGSPVTDPSVSTAPVRLAQAPLSGHLAGAWPPANRLGHQSRCDHVGDGQGACPGRVHGPRSHRRRHGWRGGSWVPNSTNPI